MKCITVDWFCSKQKYIFEKVVQKVKSSRNHEGKRRGMYKMDNGEM